jgi:F-type H+-transporting ATPase subunit epsilon
VKLAVLTPQALVLEKEVRHVRAEDATGAFGILDHHADLLTALTVSVLVYRDLDGVEHFVAVRGGILTVSGHARVDVITREAVASDDLEVLERDVLVRFRKTLAAEQTARQGAVRLQGALLHRVADYMRLERARAAAWPRARP